MLNPESTGQMRISCLNTKSHRSDCDNPEQGFTVYYTLSLGLDADQVYEVLKVEEQLVIAKVQERQTLQREPHSVC